MAETLAEAGWTFDVFVPTPLHRSRLRERGYNQAEKIAQVLSAAYERPLRQAVERTRSTASQVGLSGPERRANVLGAFAGCERLDGLSVVLIDDVATTGATLIECARACRAAGAADVRALVLATDV